MLTDFSTNPSAALVTWGPLLFALAYQAFFQPVGWGTWGVLLSSPAWLSALLRRRALESGSPRSDRPRRRSRRRSRAGAPVPGGAEQHGWPAAGLTSTVASPAGAPASGTAPGLPAGAAPAAAPAAASFAYAVGSVGDWGPSLGPTVGGRGGVKAPAATIPAAGAVAASRAEARARRRRRAAMHDHGDEFLDMDSDIGVVPDYGPQASDQGAGTARVRRDGAQRHRCCRRRG